jgi:hypothetical protein
MRQPSTPAPVALATLVLVGMTAAACGHSSPAAPDTATARTDAALAMPAALASKPGGTPSVDAKFPLLAGVFTISDRKGNVSGIYTGETIESNGISSTTLRLEVQSGTGGLAGAVGVLNGTGSGAFTGEGAFSLAVSGNISTSARKNAKFRESLKGWANIGCDAAHVIISLHADKHGVARGAELRHEVGNAGCGL